MSVPRFITNPARGEEAETQRAQLTRSMMFLTLAFVVTGLSVGAYFYFVEGMVAVAVGFVVFEALAIIYLAKTLPRSIAAKAPDHVVAGSYLAGLTVNEFTTPRQLWDAAVCVRDTGDKSRAQQILGA